MNLFVTILHTNWFWIVENNCDHARRDIWTHFFFSIFVLWTVLLSSYFSIFVLFLGEKLLSASFIAFVLVLILFSRNIDWTRASPHFLDFLPRKVLFLQMLALMNAFKQKKTFNSLLFILFSLCTFSLCSTHPKKIQTETFLLNEFSFRLTETFRLNKGSNFSWLLLWVALIIIQRARSSIQKTPFWNEWQSTCSVFKIVVDGVAICKCIQRQP